MMRSTVAAKPAGVQAELLPQSIPSSTSMRYFTSVVPVPTMSVPPLPTVKVPAPCGGTPSLAGGGAFVFGASAPAETVFFNVVVGFDAGLPPGLFEVPGEREGIAEGVPAAGDAGAGDGIPVAPADGDAADAADAGCVAGLAHAASPTISNSPAVRAGYDRTRTATTPPRIGMQCRSSMATAGTGLGGRAHVAEIP
jgi:hypothetical protein